MVEREVFLTPEGLKNLENELDLAKTVKRKDIAAKIKHALAFGDISENAEYDQAKNEQGQLEEKISKLEDMLRNAKIIDEAVKMNTMVRRLLTLNEIGYTVDFTIINSNEAGVPQNRDRTYICGI